MKNTFRDNLYDFSSSIQKDIKRLLIEYSDLIYDNPNTNSVVFVRRGDYSWQELSLEGKRLQSKIRDDYKKYKTIIESLIDNSNHSKLNQSHNTINEAIEQEHRSFSKTSQEAFNEVSNSFSEIDHLLDFLHSANNTCLLVADTNALLKNPKIENWGFDGIGDFVIVLTPTVLSELDRLKVNHRNEAVREKSKKMINQIKEYRRRGNILDGIKIKGDSISLKTIATEPNFENTLPWLEKDNNDDRFIASVYEIIKNNIRSSVYVVTADINMQNKVEFSCLPYLEPLQP